MKEIFLVKLGGSVITDKKTPYNANKDTIRRLAKEILQSKKNVVIAHGSGSFGHPSAVKYGGKKGYKSKLGLAKVARDAMEINRIVMEILVEEGLPAVSFRPMSMVFSEKGKTKENFFQVIKAAVSQGFIPVVYGDVIMDKNWKTTIHSGENTLNEIGIYLRKNGFLVNRIIQAGKTSGVYDGNGKTIPQISKNTWPKFKKFVNKLKVKDVTGGMLHKIEESLQMTEFGITTILVNGETKKELLKALAGKKVEGTLIK